ncbi:hypothetical protein UVI_02012550 [Ustilaginoidea virens]|nr:hypothetical protein UVI_02012550 [Ustilaginoidea virens]
MQRQDSGYESHVSGSARNSMSQTRPGHPCRPVSNGSSGGGVATTSRCRTVRPSTRRWAKSYPQPNAQSLCSRAKANANAAQTTVYFQFPTPDLDLVELTETTPRRQPSAPPPPPTTHYWTSDSTRRLEYAAIDAASRGVKGWVRRHLVPDCFTPRHVAFDDDSGSVRRYRLELEEEDDDDEKMRPAANGATAQRRKGKGWFVFSLRRSSTL